MPKNKTSNKKVVVKQIPDTALITSPALRRIVRRAAVQRVNVSVWDTLRTSLELCVRSVLRDVLNNVEYFHRMTATLEDLYSVAALNGTPVVVGIHKDLKATKTLKLVRSFNVDSNAKGKRKPGKVALQEIRKAQRPENIGLVIPRKNFANFVKGVAQERMPAIRFREGFIAVFQMFIEQALIELCDNARLCAFHDSGRTTVGPRDVELATHISNRWYFN